MTDYKATPEQWADVADWAADNGVSHACLLELRARVEVLEAAAQKHIVETSANILALFSRVESLEAAKRPASKVYEINEPLKLTPKQAQQVRDLLAPEPQRNYPAKPDSSLVERVRNAIASEYNPADFCWDEARAAIREVAAWMTSNRDVHFPPSCVFALEQEAER